MNALELHCVTVATKTAEAIKRLNAEGKADIDTGKMNKDLDALLVKLHLDKPQWRFEVCGDYYSRLDRFKVYQDSECLGEVQRAYIGRKVGFGFSIKNDRIADSMVRGSSYQTGDMDKAYVKIKKMFTKKSLNERFEKASANAIKTIVHNHAGKRGMKSDIERRLHRYALDYAMHAGFNQFMEYINTKAPVTDRNTVQKAIADIDQLTAELETIEQVKENLNTPRTAFIIKDGAEYIYKHMDKLTTYSDTTLPDELRGKLGLLKLVETEHYIENTGCKVDENVFVIVLEDEDAR